MASVGEHAQAFIASGAGMLGDADRSLAAGAPDPVRAGAGDRVGALWRTDAELAELLRDLAAAFEPRLANAPGQGRNRRMPYTVVMPAPEQTTGDGRPARKPRRSSTTRARKRS